MGPGRQRDAVDLRPQDGSGLGVGRMHGVGRVKGHHTGEALGRAPEQGPSRGDGVLREGEDQLRDAVVELALQGK